MFIGLTGGIGSGKSEALAACQRLGAAVLSSDAVVHELLGTEEVTQLLVERWGQRVLSGEAIDRGAVAEIVFGQPHELAWLEQTLFPRVARRTLQWRRELEQTANVEVAVVEVPLLFEAGLEVGFDATIAVVADEELRAARAGSRDHKGLDGRGARQLSQEEKAARATYVVRNDHSLERLESRIAEVIEHVKTGERS